VKIQSQDLKGQANKLAFDKEALERDKDKDKNNEEPK
jgi:hypothetical protein